MSEAQVSRLPGQFWVLWLALVVNRMAKMVVPFMALYLVRERGLGPIEVSAVLTMHGVGELLAGVTSGAAADRLGRKWLMVASLLSTAIVVSSFGLLASPWALALAAMAMSSVTSLYGPAANALVGDNVPPALRYRAFALLHWAANIGWGLAPLLAGLLAERSYGLLFVAEAAVSVACAAFVAVAVRDRPVHAAEPGTVSAGGSSPLRDRGFLAYCTLALGVGVLFAQVAVAIPLYLGEAGITEADFGRIMAVNGAVIVLLQPVLSRHLLRLPAAVVLVAGPLLTGLGFGMHGLGLALSIQVAAVAVWSVGEVVWSPISQVIVTSFAERGDRVRYYGLYNVFAGLSVLLGPPLGALALGLLGAWFWPLCVGLGAAVAVGFVGLGVARRITDEAAVAH